MTITKELLVEKACELLQLKSKQGLEFIENLFEELSNSLEQGKNVKITNFGSFVLRDKKPRPGRNPKTKKDVEISARRVVTFKIAKTFKMELKKIQS